VRPTDVSVEHRTPELAAVGEVPRQGRRSRSQIVLGCIGLVLLATGVLLATVTARREWAPPLELSVIHEQDGQSVAKLNWGSTGPIVAQLEVVAEGRVQWSSPLSRNAAAQNVILPSSLLGPQSRVIVVSKGHTLRGVDG
jgi:hypothetical protein